MKLRNKRTGEIGSLQPYGEDGRIWVWISNISKPEYRYNSLAELNEEWEDYEETNSINEIDVVLDSIGEYCNEHSYYSGDLEKIKILNTVEEKLKAWKRLKDKGFKVDLWDYDGGNYQERIKTGRILFRVKDYEENDKDLDLLFGGEE